MTRTFEWSDGFDAVGWHIEFMSKPDYDEYYDDCEEPNGTRMS